MKKHKGQPGPKPQILKIEGVNWKDAIKKSFQKKRPAEGWPKLETRKKGAK